MLKACKSLALRYCPGITVAVLLLVTTAFGPIGNGAAWAEKATATRPPGGSGYTSNATSRSDPNPLYALQTVQINGGYESAGVAMRNLGYGTIDLTGIPSGSTVEYAYLLWDVL